MTDATRLSVNTAFYNLVQEVGPEEVSDLALQMGADDPLLPSMEAPKLDPVPSITLGTSPMSPYQHACAMSTLSSEGTHAPCHLVDKIEGAGGAVPYQHEGETEEVFDPEVANMATSALQRVLIDGTAAGKGIGRPAAGKTGTAQNNTSAWFSGYTPDLVASVGMGYDKTRSLGSIRGGTVPASIWQQFMRSALAGTPVKEFPVPPAPNAPAPEPEEVLPEPSEEPTEEVLPEPSEEPTDDGSFDVPEEAPEPSPTRTQKREVREPATSPEPDTRVTTTTPSPTRSKTRATPVPTPEDDGLYAPNGIESVEGE